MNIVDEKTMETIEEKTIEMLSMFRNGHTLLEHMSELFCLNHFKMKIIPRDIGIINPNPMSPFGRFGLTLNESVLFAECIGIVAGGICSSLKRYPTEKETDYILDTMSLSFTKQIKKIMKDK